MAICHSLTFFVTLLAAGAGPGTYYTPECPPSHHAPAFLVSGAPSAPPAAVRRWPPGASEEALLAAAVSSASFSVAHVALMVICFIWYGRSPVLAPVAVGLAHLAMSLLVRLPSPPPDPRARPAASAC